MSNFAIRAEGLGKRYRIGAAGRAPYRTLRETLVDTARAPFRRASARLHPNGRAPGAADTSFWALKDVSFEVQPGEVVGIIGRNGAGKSTLLKILARITKPTEGQACIRGRIGSLLEVGTGFHGELTGRENVFLSGAIIGMKRAEIERKFDEIVAFAEVEKFIDTPVKHYSSGMYLRLAFAVAAHLEPEILLVDEVLAVGDVAFQQKCLSHFRELTRHGMTIVLVSHNMAAVQSSCEHAFCLEGGRLVSWGKPLPVIEDFRRSMGNTTPQPTAEGGSANLEITAFEMYGEDGTPRRDIRFGEAVRIRITLNARQRIVAPMINFGIRRADGVVICGFNNWYDNVRIDYLEGECSLEGWLPRVRLTPGFYEIHTLVWPWGGGHLGGNLSNMRPLATRQFGEFYIYGPGLNAEDGVFQVPARKWVFRRADSESEYIAGDSTALERSFLDLSD